MHACVPLAASIPCTLLVLLLHQTYPLGFGVNSSLIHTSMPSPTLILGCYCILLWRTHGDLETSVLFASKDVIRRIILVFIGVRSYVVTVDSSSCTRAQAQHAHPRIH
jgi:hypothetical protein